ncbi:glycine--tRNA ligase subunit beta [Enterobacterales bacterium endosymbiont of Anomoneura mori]|uniref:glycine--tRNA ligase subunit beta n=1 Tax=Enterobacterales bacterium endosymbiont of Anomoneura mori TaxID=3132096 RepID=UPI00399C7840
MKKKNFLIEIGTEDLPSKLLIKISKNFFLNFIKELKKNKIEYYKIYLYSTLRRLAIKINNLKINKTILNYKKKKIKIDNILKNNKNKKKIFEKKIIKIINNSLNKINNFKKMRWNNNNFYFIRPIRNIIVMLNNNIIPIYIFGIKSKRKLYGHLFMSKKSINIKNVNEYPNILYLKCKVIADYNIRKFLIIKKSLFKIKKKKENIDFDKNLLNEVTSLVEWPVILIGHFKKIFLKCPIELLINIMKNSQKIFPIYNNKKKIISKFILIINIKSINSNIIIKDNENLLNSRFNEINNFLKNDFKKPLENNLKKLKYIIFKKKLGSLYEKTFRNQILSFYFLFKNNINVNYIIRSSLFFKCDLLTNIVYENINLHSIIGMYYLHYYKESEIISISINKKKIFLNKKINKLTSLLIISDKIDFLVGIFGIKNFPKKKNDPFEIKRCVSNILNTIIKNKIKINFINIIKKSILLYGNKLNNNNVINDVINYIFKRFCYLYIKKGYSEKIIKSINKNKFLNILNFIKILKSIKYFLNFKESKNLIFSNKRILNILKKTKEILNNKINKKLLIKKYEIKLYKKINILKKKIKNLINKKKYKDIFKEYIKFNKIIDIFFKNVLIMDKNKLLSVNRLKLLNEIKKIFLKILNISKLN